MPVAGARVWPRARQWAKCVQCDRSSEVWRAQVTNRRRGILSIECVTKRRAEGQVVCPQRYRALEDTLDARMAARPAQSAVLDRAAFADLIAFDDPWSIC